MDMMSKLTISASMLLTGFVIVFSVLVFLIFIIWLMGKIVTGAQNSITDRKKQKVKESLKKPEVKAEVEKPRTALKPVKSDTGVSDEVIAVISAAVYSMYGSKEKVRIKSINKSSSRSAWANAGVLKNTRPF
ncbi:MAG: OadG family protein [Ruminococcus sp.]|nr:OadG family protein [Ruminococcus sp.]